MKIKVQQPDYRNLGKLQFIRGYTGFGAAECVHLTYEEYRKRIEAKCGPGTLVEEDGVFYWVNDAPEPEPVLSYEI